MTGDNNNNKWTKNWAKKYGIRSDGAILLSEELRGLLNWPIGTELQVKIDLEQNSVTLTKADIENSSPGGNQ
jgi:hypothetical protein